ncbi:hypothetical protein [Flavobacterium sp.]
MNRIITLILLLSFVSSCKLIDKEEETDEVVKGTATKDSVVHDKDENGCLASAGYVWSKVNRECVKGFSGIQLNPIDKPDNEDETLSAYVMFNEDASQAEVFLPKDTASIVLTRKAEGQPWILNDWQLIPWKGYVLKKGNENKYAGDGEMGQKSINTDTEEQE